MRWGPFILAAVLAEIVATAVAFVAVSTPPLHG
jgi:hypothetical protein